MRDRSHLSEQTLDARARRAAQRAGLMAKKSRWRRNSIDNFGGFMLLDPRTNFVVAGSRFDLSAYEVAAFAKRRLRKRVKLLRPTFEVGHDRLRVF